MYYATTSEGLARDVAALLLRLGIIARLTTSVKAGYRPSFHVRVSGAAAQREFLRVVGAHGPRVAPADALAERLADVTTNTNVDTLPAEAFALVRARMQTLGVSQRQMAAMRGTAYGGTAHFAFAPSRAVLLDYATRLDDDELRDLATSDVFWDRVVAVEPGGDEDVFDLTVPGVANWLADGIVSHNSGALEQDADVVIMIFREEMYKSDRSVPAETDGIAELIIAKQRNGPTGTVKTAFIAGQTKFMPLAPRSPRADLVIRCTSARVDLAAVQANYRALAAYLAGDAELNRARAGCAPRLPASSRSSRPTPTATARCRWPGRCATPGRPGWPSPTSRKGSNCATPAIAAGSWSSARSA